MGRTRCIGRRLPGSSCVNTPERADSPAEWVAGGKGPHTMCGPFLHATHPLAKTGRNFRVWSRIGFAVSAPWRRRTLRSGIVLCAVDCAGQESISKRALHHAWFAWGRFASRARSGAVSGQHAVMLPEIFCPYACQTFRPHCIEALMRIRSRREHGVECCAASQGEMRASSHFHAALQHGMLIR